MKEEKSLISSPYRPLNGGYKPHQNKLFVLAEYLSDVSGVAMFIIFMKSIHRC